MVVNPPRLATPSTGDLHPVTTVYVITRGKTVVAKGLATAQENGRLQDMDPGVCGSQNNIKFERRISTETMTYS